MWGRHCTLTCSQKAACTARLPGHPPPRCPACAGSRPQTAETRVSTAKERGWAKLGPGLQPPGAWGLGTGTGGAAGAGASPAPQAAPRLGCCRPFPRTARQRRVPIPLPGGGGCLHCLAQTGPHPALRSLTRSQSLSPSCAGLVAVPQQPEPNWTQGSLGSALCPLKPWPSLLGVAGLCRPGVPHLPAAARPSGPRGLCSGCSRRTQKPEGSSTCTVWDGGAGADS